MKEIVERLHENRKLEQAKSILESQGYRVKAKKLQENKINDLFSEGENMEDTFDWLFSEPDEDPEVVADINDLLDTSAKMLGCPRNKLMCICEDDIFMSIPEVLQAIQAAGETINKQDTDFNIFELYDIEGTKLVVAKNADSSYVNLIWEDGKQPTLNESKKARKNESKKMTRKHESLRTKKTIKESGPVLEEHVMYNEISQYFDIALENILKHYGLDPEDDALVQDFYYAFSPDVEAIIKFIKGRLSNVTEAQVPLNPKSNDDKLDKLSSKPLSTLRPFSKTDWYGWAGATKLASGSDPYIWEDDDYVMIVCSDGEYAPDEIDENTPARVEVYFGVGPEDYDMLQAYTLTGPEKEIVPKADEIAKKLSQGMDLKKLARQYGMSFEQY